RTPPTQPTSTETCTALPLHNHHLTNTIPLPTHPPILFLNSQNNLSQNRRHCAQNLSHANPSLPTGHHPTNSPGPKTICRKIGDIVLKISRMLKQKGRSMSAAGRCVVN